MKTKLIWISFYSFLLFASWCQWPVREDVTLSCLESIDRLLSTDIRQKQQQIQLLLYSEPNPTRFCSSELGCHLTRSQKLNLDNYRYSNSSVLIPLYQACLTSSIVKIIENNLPPSSCKDGIVAESRYLLQEQLRQFNKQHQVWQMCQLHPSGQTCLAQRGDFRRFIQQFIF